MSSQTARSTTGYASTRCRYHGRTCDEPRDTKPNGDLHRYCRMHRMRHNQYQRESQRRRLAREREAAANAIDLIDLTAATSFGLHDEESDEALFVWPQASLPVPSNHGSPNAGGRYQFFEIDDLLDYWYAAYE